MSCRFGATAATITWARIPSSLLSRLGHAVDEPSRGAEPSKVLAHCSRRNNPEQHILHQMVAKNQIGLRPSLGFVVEQVVTACPHLLLQGTAARLIPVSALAGKLPVTHPLGHSLGHE